MCVATALVFVMFCRLVLELSVVFSKLKFAGGIVLLSKVMLESEGEVRVVLG